MTIGNILQDMPYHPAIAACNVDLPGGRNLLKELMNALEKSYEQKEYPENSKSFHILWQVLAGVSNLCRNRLLQKHFVRFDLIPFLKKCLKDDNEAVLGVRKEKVQKYATITLELLKEGGHLSRDSEEEPTG